MIMTMIKKKKTKKKKKEKNYFGPAAPAFKRPIFKSILPMAVFKRAAACSWNEII